MNDAFDFDVDRFLNDLRGSQQQPSYTMALALLHHIWKDHPIKLEPVPTLVALSENMAINLADVLYIRLDSDNDYKIQFKDPHGLDDYIMHDTPEWDALTRLMALLNNEH